MTNKNTTKGSIKKSTLQAGKIKFIDAIEPPLKAGEYTLEAVQEIQDISNDGKPLPTYNATREINVRGPQFSISQSIIHATYPAPLSVGGYAADLPHVVLTDFALPWSRPINYKTPSEDLETPWIGLLTLHPNEITKNTKPKIVTVQQLITPEDNIQGPVLDKSALSDQLNDQVTVIDLNFELFQKISPTIGDLKYLAHGREVNTDGKVMLGMDADGLFSLVIGNRLPAGDPENKIPVENQVFMVSYEGHENHLRNSLKPTADTIRLVVLYSYKFSQIPAASSFLGEMLALCDPGSGGVRLLQMPGDIKNITDDMARLAIDIGYTALQNDMRAGEEMTSWYRGPTVPAPTKRQEDLAYGTYLYSDHAIHYDPSTGIFDQSYASAWQLGRLLALSDGAFARTLFNWRNAYVLIAMQKAKQKNIDDNIKKLAGNFANDPRAIQDLDSSLKYSLVKSFTKQAWPMATSRKDKMLGTHLPGVLSKEEKLEIYNNGQDPLLVLLNKK